VIDALGGLPWVTAVNLVIWTGLCLWLVRLDRRVRALEGRE
jgi:CcmD family protein